MIVGKKESGRVRPIIVKFVRGDDRTAILSTQRIQREASSRIFINEDLTPRRVMAAKLSRALVQSNKLQKAYVMSGAVMIEINDGQRIKKHRLKTACLPSVTFILNRIITSGYTLNCYKQYTNGHYII